eukprot:scaffold242568_cov23-Tisochrysis_lutea.AAC.1
MALCNDPGCSDAILLCNGLQDPYHSGIGPCDCTTTLPCITLQHYHPDAFESWGLCQNLKTVCEELRDPNYHPPHK